MEPVRSIKLLVGLPKHLLVEGVNIIMHLINRSPLISLDEGLLEDAWSGKNIFLSHLKVFSYSMYVHVYARSKSKLDLKFVKCIIEND